jgi:hypothetical protein
MQLGPRSYAHGSVTGILAVVLGGGFRPAGGLRALHLGPVATRASDVLRRVAEARITVEATPGAQAEEDLAWAPLQCSLHLDGVVDRVEDEQGEGLSYSEPTQQSLDLLGGDLVGLLGGSNAPHVHGCGPALSHEVQLCYELVSPSGHDGLPRRVAGRMVVVAAFWAALRVASGPHANVHGVYGRCSALGKRMGQASSLRRASASIRPRFNPA